MVDALRTSDSAGLPRRVSTWVLAGLSVANAGYGVYVSCVLAPDVPALLVLALVAAAGALGALAGAATHRPALVAVGAIAQLASPTGFAWLASCTLALAGLVLLVVILRRRRD